MARIASLGASLQDIYLIDHDDLVPKKVGKEAVLGKLVVGSKVDIDEVHYATGGGGLNSAVTFARWGHETVLLSNVGDDAAGAAVMDAALTEGIDASYIHEVSGKATGTSVILLDSRSGERTILTYRGASDGFQDFAATDLELIQPDWLYVTTLRGDLRTLGKFLAKARELGCKVMLNPGAKELAQGRELLRLLPMVDVLLVNKSEAAQLVPGKVLTELLYHLSGYVPMAIVTDGAMGGIAGNRAETYRFGIYEDCAVRDATGAGDAFGSGFLAAYADGAGFREALVYASANSTAVISKIGANRAVLHGARQLHMMPIQRI